MSHVHVHVPSVTGIVLNFCLAENEDNYVPMSQTFFLCFLVLQESTYSKEEDMFSLHVHELARDSLQRHATNTTAERQPD